MRIFLAGVSCVGKTAIGARLAGLLEFRFFDLDIETERFFEMSIERLRNRHLTSHDFRLARSLALRHVLSREGSYNCVIALPPSGLWGALWKVVREAGDATTVVLRDAPENILGRITFYDVEPPRCKGISQIKKSTATCEKSSETSLTSTAPSAERIYPLTSAAAVSTTHRGGFGVF